MNLYAQGKRLKIPEINLENSQSQTLAPMKSEARSFSSAKKKSFGPLVKGVSTARNLRNKNNRDFKTIDVSLGADESLIKGDLSDAMGSNLPSISLKAGPVSVKKECLSCTGVPSHVMEMFKLACITYKPSQVYYRSNKLSRKRLLKMRKTLLDKCEESINQGSWAVNQGQDLRTGQVFRDLLQFYGKVD